MKPLAPFSILLLSIFYCNIGQSTESENDINAFVSDNFASENAIDVSSGNNGTQRKNNGRQRNRINKLDKDLYGHWDVERYRDWHSRQDQQDQYVDLDTCDYCAYINLRKSNNPDSRVIEADTSDGCNYGSWKYRVSSTGKVTLITSGPWTLKYCEETHWYPDLVGLYISLDKRTDGEHYLYALDEKGDTIIILHKDKSYR